MAAITTTRWTPAGPDLPGEAATFRAVPIKAGHVAQRHSHAHEQFLLVLSGGGTLQGEDGEIALTPGTALRLAPHAWHSAVFTHDTVLAEFNLHASP